MSSKRKAKLKYESAHHAILSEVESQFLKKGLTLPTGWTLAATLALFPHTAENEKDQFVDFFTHQPDLALEIMQTARQTLKAWEGDNSARGKVRWFLLQSPWLSRENAKTGEFKKLAPGDGSFRDFYPLFVEDAVRADDPAVKDIDIAEAVFGDLRPLSPKVREAKIKAVKDARRSISFPYKPRRKGREGA